MSANGALAEFSLAQLWRPELTQDRWQAYVRDWHDGSCQRGILSARNQRGGVLGFVPWWRQPDLEDGETLWAGPFVVRELGVRPLVRGRLIDEMKFMADRLAIRLRFHEAR